MHFYKRWTRRSCNLTQNVHFFTSFPQPQMQLSYPKPYSTHQSEQNNYFPINQHIIHPQTEQTQHSKQVSQSESSSKSLKFQSDDDLVEIESDLELSKSEDQDSVGSEDGIDQKGLEEVAQVVQNTQAKHKKRKNTRKIRTTITREKLAKMNQIFAEYQKNKDDGKCPKENLKEIGISLQLGYSTILHKYREFRAHKMVKGGALIASLQKKRKYKKSKQIEAIIERALAAQPFYTAVQLSDYIQHIQGKRYSRSIISRHLGEMGYSYKNLKSSPIEKNKPVFKQTRRVYANILYPLLQDKSLVILFVDQLACSVSTFQRKRAGIKPKEIFNQNPLDYVSLFLGACSHGIMSFDVRRGFYKQQKFIQLLQKCLDDTIKNVFSQNKEKTNILIITDMNKIHLDPTNVSDDMKPIKSWLHKYQAKRYYLPPSSPQLNPIESMFANLKSKLFKREIQGPIELQMQMRRCAEEIKMETVDAYFQDMEKCLNEVMRDQTKIDNQAEFSASNEMTK